MGFKAETSQHFHCVGRHLDAGADAGEARRLLEDVDVVPRTREQRCCGQPADACAHYRDIQFDLQVDTRCVTTPMVREG